MKKILYTIMSLMVAAFSLQSCEDVPAPYDKPGEGGGDTPSEEITAQGTGTAEDPYNVAGILAATADLASGSSLDGTVYIKGIVTSVKECSASYGNATFYLGDTQDASSTFYVYRCLGLNNKNITSDDAVQEGDTIVVCGTVTNYNGTIETSAKAAYIYQSSRSGGGSAPAGDAIVKTCAEASAIALALSENNAATSETYSITGYITAIVGSVSQGQQTFWMADTKDGGKVFEAYWANLPAGVSEFKVGSKVTIVGNIMKYNTTPEIKNATVTILEEGSGSSDTPSGSVISKTCSEASAIALALSANSTPTSEIYAITGYITNVIGSVSSNQQSFWMADTKDGGKVFEAYWANLPSGISEFTVGMKVKITGNIMKYNTTPEIKNATVEILEGGGSSSGGESGGGSSSATELTNGNFETWADGLPTGWKSSCTASSATLSQSSDAHGGSYSVCVQGNTSSNKRLAYKELTLEAGTYTFSFYAKATATPSQVRPGYVPVTDGSVGSYAYGDYADISTSWTLVSHTFTLDAKTTICLVVMNPKKSTYSSGADILIDDATLTKGSSAKRKVVIRRR